MGTPAVITFLDADGEEYSVYQHWDGDPETVIPAILSIEKCWQWPRWEADEAAAAYIATHKTGQGNIRLCNNRVGAEFTYTVQLVSDRKNPYLKIRCSYCDGKFVTEDHLVPNGESKFQEV